MEKYWNMVKYGNKESDSGYFPTGDKLWDLTRKYMHVGILEIAEQGCNEDRHELALFVGMIIQAGKDLHDKDAEIALDAKKYIHSDLFEKDCALIGLEDEIVKILLLRSVENKSEIMAVMDGESEGA